MTLNGRNAPLLEIEKSGSCGAHQKQESLAIAKMSARCALCIPISYSP